ncbi:MAG: hypothetical protein RLZZ618_3232 [Pseudomonadota bacterium]|jgi:hypothetical protein
MYRCLVVCVAAATLALPAFAQMKREFPQNALRGRIEFGTPPLIKLNGDVARLAPGARIRGTDNMIAMSGGLVGQRFVVNYTVDISGLVRDVWVLRDEELKVRPWPVTPEQAQTWAFDPAAQTWTRR